MQSGIGDWLGVAAYVQQWAQELAKDLLAVDLWGQFAQQRSIISFQSRKPNADDFTVFTSSERVALRRSLSIAKEEIRRQLQPTSDEMEHISSRLDYLAEASERLSRFDWKGLFIGIVTSIAVNLTVDTNSGQVLLKIFQQAFSQVLHLLP